MTPVIIYRLRLIFKTDIKSILYTHVTRFEFLRDHLALEGETVIEGTYVRVKATYPIETLEYLIVEEFARREKTSVEQLSQNLRDHNLKERDR